MLVRALIIGLLASLAGPLFSAMTGGVSWTEIHPLNFVFWVDGATVAVLLGTSVLRANLAPLP
jgi:hypothetical protein